MPKLLFVNKGYWLVKFVQLKTISSSSTRRF